MTNQLASWKFRRIDERSPHRDGFGYVSDEQGRDILHVGERSLSEAENVAVGNLAAIAPELLAALIDLTDMSIDDWTTANRASNSPEAAKLRNAFAVIAKATGGVS